MFGLDTLKKINDEKAKSEFESKKRKLLKEIEKLRYRYRAISECMAWTLDDATITVPEPYDIAKEALDEIQAILNGHSN